MTSEIRRGLEFAKKLAKEAGAFLRSRQGKIQKISYKGRINLVTDVDIMCERLIIKRIRSSFSTHGILTEESADIAGSNSSLRWVIDPLDGTTNYAHSFPFFCVSIALMDKEKAIVGVVYDPVRDELFYATKNGGAFSNNKIIKTSKIKRLDRSLLVTGFPYRFGNAMKRNIGNFTRFMMKAQAVRRAGSAALDLCYVACGRFDGFWEIDLHPWDTAAGALIAEEAGGRVTTFTGKDFNPFKKEIAASNSYIHKQMLEVLK